MIDINQLQQSLNSLRENGETNGIGNEVNGNGNDINLITLRPSNTKFTKRCFMSLLDVESLVKSGVLCAFL